MYIYTYIHIHIHIRLSVDVCRMYIYTSISDTRMYVHMLKVPVRVHAHVQLLTVVCMHTYVRACTGTEDQAGSEDLLPLYPQQSHGRRGPCIGLPIKVNK